MQSMSHYLCAPQTCLVVRHLCRALQRHGAKSTSPMHCNHTIARRHDQRLLRASCSAKWRVDSPGSLSTESYGSIDRTMPPRTESYGRILLSQARRRERRGPKVPSSLMLGSSSALERLTWIVHAKLSYHSLWSSCLFSLGLSSDFTSVFSLPTLLSPATCCQNEWSGWWRNRPSAHTLRSRLRRQHDSTTGLANWRRRAATLPCLASSTPLVGESLSPRVYHVIQRRIVLRRPGFLRIEISCLWVLTA